MSKFDLKSNSSVKNIEKGNLYINSSKLKTIHKNIEKELDVVRSSLMNVNTLLNKVVKMDCIGGKRTEIFKGWAKVSKTQALAALKLKEQYNEKYKDDLQSYILKVLDERITDIEKRIDALLN